MDLIFLNLQMCNRERELQKVLYRENTILVFYFSVYLVGCMGLVLQFVKGCPMGRYNFLSLI